jgi:hypothetical protein
MSFNYQPKCTRCLDIGVLELVGEDFPALSLCHCEVGKRQIWKLPTVPKGAQVRQMRWQDFKPTEQMGYQQKIEWWRETVKISEKYWASQTKEISSI